MGIQLIVFVLFAFSLVGCVATPSPAPDRGATTRSKALASPHIEIKYAYGEEGGDGQWLLVLRPGGEIVDRMGRDIRDSDLRATLSLKQQRGSELHVTLILDDKAGISERDIATAVAKILGAANRYLDPTDRLIIFLYSRDLTKRMQAISSA